MLHYSLYVACLRMFIARGTVPKTIRSVTFIIVLRISRAALGLFLAGDSRHTRGSYKTTDLRARGKS